MFGGMAYKIGVLAKKATGGGGADVTPNAVNWEVDVVSIGAFSCRSTTQTITGINTAITLSFSSTADPNLTELLYYKNNAPTSFLSTGSATVSVSTGDTIRFQIYSGGPVVSTTITITNISDGNTVLDTVQLFTTGD